MGFIKDSLFSGGCDNFSPAILLEEKIGKDLSNKLYDLTKDKLNKIYKTIKGKLLSEDIKDKLGYVSMDIKQEGENIEQLYIKVKLNYFIQMSIKMKLLH